MTGLGSGVGNTLKSGYPKFFDTCILLTRHHSKELTRIFDMHRSFRATIKTVHCKEMRIRSKLPDQIRQSDYFAHGNQSALGDVYFC